jgi:hypothetical protein
LVAVAQSKAASSVFVYTEVVRCGEIGVIALRSFFTFHPNQKVHVFGLESDRWSVADFKNAVFHSLDKPDPALEKWDGLKQRFLMAHRYKTIAKNFDKGHLGTASLWAHLIKTRSEQYLVHFDSDVVFRAEALSDITNSLDEFDLIGPIRHYKHNPHGNSHIKGHPDVAQTVFFGFNRKKVSDHDYETLTKMCQGSYNPQGFEVLDFFDPVSFEILSNGGKVKGLAVDDYGGEDSQGGRLNKYKTLNAVVDFGDKLAHFSAVGSGLNFYKNRHKIKDVPNSYVQYGLEKYAVYKKLFYDEDIGIDYDGNKYAPLFKVDRWY